MTAHPASRTDRVRPWLTAAWIAAVLAIIIGSALIWVAVAGLRVLQPTGTVDQAPMVQVAATSAATSLLEAGIFVVVALLTIAGVRRAVGGRDGVRGAGAPAGFDRSVIALAVIAVLGAALAIWSAGWQGDPVGSVSYFGAPTYDDLRPLRLQILASAAAGSATIAAVGGCIGVVIVVVARLRAR